MIEARKKVLGAFGYVSHQKCTQPIRLKVKRENLPKKDLSVRSKRKVQMCLFVTGITSKIKAIQTWT